MKKLETLAAVDSALPQLMLNVAIQVCAKCQRENSAVGLVLGEAAHCRAWEDERVPKEQLGAV